MRWLLIVAVLLAACGGSEERAATSKTSSPTRTPAPPAAPAATSVATGAGAPTATAAPATGTASDVTRALLRDEDMPPGWVGTERPAPQQEDEVAHVCGVVRTYKVLARAKRQFSYTAQPLVVDHTVTAFVPGDAQRVLDDNRELLRQCAEFREISQSGVRTYRLSPLSFPNIGDQSLAMRMDVDAASGPVQQLVLVMVRRGDVTSALAFNAPPRASIDTAMIEGLARRADERLLALISGR